MTFFHVNIFEEYVFCERKQFVINHACFWLSEKTAKEGSFVSLVTDLKISPRWALNDQCTLQALPWNNRSLEDFAAFVPKKCLESKKKRETTVQNPAFYHVFCEVFFWGGRSMGGVFWVVLMIFKTWWWSFSPGKFGPEASTCIQKTTPEVFALSSTGISILRKPSICQPADSCHWTHAVSVHRIFFSETFWTIFGWIVFFWNGRWT